MPEISKPDSLEKTAFSTDEKASFTHTGDVGPDVWLDEHGDYLFRFAALRVQDVHVAEELVQETLVKAIQAFKNFRGEASVRTWLCQILRNLISSHFRKVTRERKLKQAVEDPDMAPTMGQLLHPKVHSKDFQTAVEKEEFWIVIRKCFDKTPDHLLETFLMRLCNEDDDIETLSENLDIKPSNFSVRLFRTRLLLRKCVERFWLKNE